MRFVNLERMKGEEAAAINGGGYGRSLEMDGWICC